VGTRTRTWLLVTALATAVTVVAPAPPADATTTATPKGNVVTIHVSVDVIGGKGQTGPDGQSLVDYWEQVLQDTWGSAFDQLPYKNCLKFKLDLDLKARSRDATVLGDRRAPLVLSREGRFKVGVRACLEKSSLSSTSTGGSVAASSSEAWWRPA